MAGIKGLRYSKKSAYIKSAVRKLGLIVFDFDGVFTDNRVFVMQDGTEGVLCSRADGFGLERLKKLGIKMFVLSREKNPVVGARCKKLKLPCIQGCDNKADMLRKESERLGIPLQNTAYLGNDINDLECLELVGLPACVADSYPEVMAVSRFITTKKGGEGAVREFCDYVAEIKTNILATDDNYGK